MGKIKYKIIREAEHSYLEKIYGMEAVELMKQDDEKPVIVEYRCPKCRRVRRTVWMYPSVPMVFETICCGIEVVFEPNGEKYVNLIGTKGLDAYVIPLSDTGKLMQALREWERMEKDKIEEGDNLGALAYRSLINTVHFNEKEEAWVEEIEMGKAIKSDE